MSAIHPLRTWPAYRRLSSEADNGEKRCEEILKFAGRKRRSNELS